MNSRYSEPTFTTEPVVLKLYLSNNIKQINCLAKGALSFTEVHRFEPFSSI